MDNLNIEVDSKLKIKAEKIINDLGFNLEDVIVSFLEQVALNKGIPFNINDNDKKI